MKTEQETKIPNNFKTVDKNQEKSILPTWCKVGQWVFDNDNVLWIIDNIDKDIIVLKIYKDSKSSLLLKYESGKLFPVRFRPYTYAEATKLKGKFLEFNPDGLGTIGLVINAIWNVCEDKSYIPENGSGIIIYINGYTQNWLIEKNATIDKLPLGVPEIDPKYVYVKDDDMSVDDNEYIMKNKTKHTKIKIPKWCKHGQWIFDNNGVLCKIDEISENEVICKYPNTDLILNILDFANTNIRPVKFRPYDVYLDYNNLDSLIGKKIKYVTHDASMAYTEIITSVGIGMKLGNNDIYINGKHAKYLFDCHANIDDKPMGVPVVDEEAMEKNNQ